MHKRGVYSCTEVIYCIFIRFVVGCVYNYVFYTIVAFATPTTVNANFYRCQLWRLLGAFVAGGVCGVGLNLKKSCYIKFTEKPLKIGGILHFQAVFFGQFSLRLVHLFTHNSQPYHLHPIPHSPTYPNG